MLLHISFNSCTRWPLLEGNEWEFKWTAASCDSCLTKPLIIQPSWEGFRSSWEVRIRSEYPRRLAVSSFSFSRNTRNNLFWRLANLGTHSVPIYILKSCSRRTCRSEVANFQLTRQKTWLIALIPRTRRQHLFCPVLTCELCGIIMQ